MTRLRRDAEPTALDGALPYLVSDVNGGRSTFPERVSDKPSAVTDARFARSSTRRLYLALFALKYLLKVRSAPQDPSEAALGPAPKTRREKLVRRFEGRALQRILDESRPASPEHIREVPRIRPSDLTPEKFIEGFYGVNRPVIIEGLIKDSKAVRDWTLPWFKQNYGSEVLEVLKERVTRIKDFELGTAHITLADAIDRMLAGQPTYINNYSGVLTDNPGLIEEIDPHKLQRYVPAFAKDPIATQLFIGGKRSGSSLHCAAGGNFFCMIHGEKKWTLANPDFTPYMYPILHPMGLYAASAIDALKPYEELDQEGYRLWRHVPKHAVHMKEGDVLYNPAWWWHMVENPTDTSIGLAFRVGTKNPFAGNPLFMALILSNPHMVKMASRWLFTHRPARDEHMLDHIFKANGGHHH